MSLMQMEKLAVFDKKQILLWYYYYCIVKYG